MKKMVVLTIAILFFSCKNSEVVDQLPPITVTGANTFGCVINGEVLIPKDATNYSPGPVPRGFKAYYEENTLMVDAGNLEDESGDKIFLYIYNLSSSGKIDLNNAEYLATNFKPDYSYLWLRDDKGEIYLSNTFTGVINITRFDLDNGIVSGNFDNLILVNKEDASVSVEITDGRFDINLNTVNS